MVCLSRSSVEEVSYLHDLGFLSEPVVDDIFQYRRRRTTSNSASISGRGSGSGSSSGSSSIAEEGELLDRQQAAAVRDCVGTVLASVAEMQQLHANSCAALLQSAAASSVEATVSLCSMMNLLSATANTTTSSAAGAAASSISSTSSKAGLGLVARTVQEYLLHRARKFAIDPSSPSSASAVDPLRSCLEFIESPLKKAARAGLGYLARGLGRLVMFCYVLLCFVCFLMLLSKFPRRRVATYFSRLKKFFVCILAIVSAW
jgi:hypothetical protein